MSAGTATGLRQRERQRAHESAHERVRVCVYIRCCFVGVDG